MWAGIQTALSLLYPPRCLGCGALVDSDFGLCGACWRDTPFIDGAVCESCGGALPGHGDGHRLECDDCMKVGRPWDAGRAAMLYRDRARQMVLALKHGDRPEIARPGAQWMAQAARELVEPGMVVVPVPLHRLRLMRRKYNQSNLLSKGIARELGLEHRPDLLLRQRHTASMDGKTAEERFALLEGSIRINPSQTGEVAGRSFLLVDDVMTSGATFSACARALKAGGAGTICVVALARVTKDG